jgi:hypothetical protein
MGGREYQIHGTSRGPASCRVSSNPCSAATHIPSDDLASELGIPPQMVNAYAQCPSTAAGEPDGASELSTRH